MIRSGNYVGNCAICGNFGLLGSHHQKPKWWILKREGPVWLICAPCHNRIHERFTNQQLRAMGWDDTRAALCIQIRPTATSTPKPTPDTPK